MSRAIVDANEAVALIAYKTNEVIAIYPITPSSPMAEHCDVYASNAQNNIFGDVTDVIEMQSEGGASGALHGALQSGALSTTFTASQGLLLMIPNMYKIAGELTPTVFHVAARSLAAQGLSIFGDHGDVMACRQTGFAMLASCDAQEAHDFALIAQAATLEARVPIMHFFDGFRTSHELMNIELVDDEMIEAMIDLDLVGAHKSRALDPEHPVLRGTAQNPDVYFQGRETVNPYYARFADIMQKQMDAFAILTKRQYSVYEYYGADEAKRLIVIMASGAKSVKECIDTLGEKESIGVLIVRLYRPFNSAMFLNAIPKSVEAVAVLDRTKEPGCSAEPLHLDVQNAYMEALMEKSIEHLPKIIGGRYGLSSKEFTPAMIKAIYDELSKAQSKNHFTVGINDDVSHTSLPYDELFCAMNAPQQKQASMYEAMFYGLGSDGTVGANKNSIKIIGDDEHRHVQGYFVYDSKKAGSMTTSHLRFSDQPINSTYLIEKADFIGVHQFVFMLKFDLLKTAKEGATILLNAPYAHNDIWHRLPQIAQQHIIEKSLKVHAINAFEVAKSCGLGRRINTIMQVCFFALSEVMPIVDAVDAIKSSIIKTYGKKGEMIVKMNMCGVDKAIDNLHSVPILADERSTIELLPLIKMSEPNSFVEEVTSKLVAFEGDSLPVSKIPADGTWPLGTTQYEKREIALEAPVWDPDVCITCNKCVEVCPHAVIRSKVFEPEALNGAPESFLARKPKGKEFEEQAQFNISVSVEDCTGCSMCVEQCPAKNKSDLSKKAINMAPIEPIHDEAVANWAHFLQIPDYDRTKLNTSKVKEAQLLRPLFEFSGACPGCGETPYVKLVSQLFGDRMIVANATGCSSIYGGNLPTTPWTTDENGRGPAWSNSLFEDNAEFGLGMRAAIDAQSKTAATLLRALESELGSELVNAMLNNAQLNETEIKAARQTLETIEKTLQQSEKKEAKQLLHVSKYLLRKSVWAMGGDGWAYDIGYGGLDHTLASGANVNILVLDTQVYSNTGGQTSKATPVGAVAKFSSSGKTEQPKDIAKMALSYGNVYVARVAMGASDTQTLKAFIEAERYDGPSIIIAYSHCVAHGYDMKYGFNQQKLAVESGLWPLFRYDPSLIAEGKNPFSLDYKEPKIDVEKYMYNETRYKMVIKMNPELAQQYLDEVRDEVKRTWVSYKDLAQTGNLTQELA